LIFFSFETRSRTSVLPCPCRIKPLTPRTTSRAGTLLSGSVRSVTSAVCGLTFVTRPISPSPVTTGVLTRMPAVDPAAIVTSCANALVGYAMTVVFTER
jgi:hypothetical protein